MAICLTDDMDKLVRPEKQSLWDAKKREWFVCDPSDPYELRLPGKMKLEWTTTNGAIVALVYSFKTSF